MPDYGACAGRTYLERGEPVVVERGWRGRHAKRNVLILRGDGTRTVRPFRGLRRSAVPVLTGPERDALLAEHEQDWCEHEMSSCPGGCPVAGYCTSADHQGDVAPDWPCPDVLPALGYPTREAWISDENAALDAYYTPERCAALTGGAP